MTSYGRAINQIEIISFLIQMKNQTRNDEAN